MAFCWSLLLFLLARPAPRTRAAAAAAAAADNTFYFWRFFPCYAHYRSFLFDLCVGAFCLHGGKGAHHVGCFGRAATAAAADPSPAPPPPPPPPTPAPSDCSVLQICHL